MNHIWNKRKKFVVIISAILVFILFIVLSTKDAIGEAVTGMIDINKILDHILRNEGGYVNDKADKGGETKFGISKRSYPNVDIKNLTIDDARKIYLKDYFAKAPRVNDLNLQYQIFDHAVNAGLSRSQKLYNDTLIAENQLEAFKQARRDYYTKISKNGQNAKFLKGWLRRVEVKF